MSEVTYTMIIERDGGADVVARGVALPRALVIALEYGGAGQAAVVYSDVGSMRYFAIGRRSANDGDFDCAACTVVPRTEFPALDAGRAQNVFEQVLLQHPHEFWNGRVVTDEDFARGHGGGRA